MRVFCLVLVFRRDCHWKEQNFSPAVAVAYIGFPGYFNLSAISPLGYYFFHNTTFLEGLGNYSFDHFSAMDSTCSFSKFCSSFSHPPLCSEGSISTLAFSVPLAKSQRSSHHHPSFPTTKQFSRFNHRWARWVVALYLWSWCKQLWRR